MSNQEETPKGFSFTEAPASMNFYGITRKGWNLQITLRDNDERNLIDRFIHFSEWLESKGVTPKPVGQQPTQPLPPVQGNLPPALPEPGKLQPKAPAAVSEAGETKTITVEKIKKVVNENGKTMVKVFGAPYMKYGVIAWPEAVGELFDVDQMEFGKEYMYEAKANVLIVDGKPKKVVSFS